MAEPDTKRMCLTADMQYLVLASDGLWDKVGRNSAVNKPISFTKRKKTYMITQVAAIFSSFSILLM